MTFSEIDWWIAMGVERGLLKVSRF